MSEIEPSLLLSHARTIARDNDVSCWALPTGELLVPHAAGGSTFIFVDQLEEPAPPAHQPPRRRRSQRDLRARVLGQRVESRLHLPGRRG